jgi:hypothetical protein
MITPWNCLVTAFSCATGVSTDLLVKEIGHDGGQILWPENKEPFNRCGFHSQELTDVCLRFGMSVTTIQANPVRGNQFDFHEYPVKFSVSNEKRLNRYLTGYSGVLFGKLKENNHSHAVAWSHEKKTVKDLSGKVKNISDLNIGWFFIVQSVE